MKNFLEKLKENKLIAILGAIVATVGVALIIALAAVLINLFNNGGKADIKYSDEQRSATITIGEDSTDEEHSLGEAGEEVEVEQINGEEIKTVESVDANGPVTNGEDEEAYVLFDDGEEHGLGAAYAYYDISSPQAFRNATYGICADADGGAYGSQCWDLSALFFLNYTGHTLYTCGTGAAKGAIADGCWQKNNAGGEFTMIWNPTELQAGDIVFFDNGQWGHTGTAMGSYNNGYITLLGANQGGNACPNGGSTVNIINISLAHFAGAFRPNIYIPPAPAPEPEPTPAPVVEDGYTVKKGDTLGEIAIRLGWYNTDKGILFGDEGYAQKLAEANGIEERWLIYPGQVLRGI